MGTFDVSILEFGSGVFEVLSTNGDTHLGGDDVDNVLIQYLADEFKSDTGVDLTKDPMAMQRLKEAAEKAKIELSSSLSTEVNLPYITVLDGVPQHLVKSITRAKFEQLIDGIVRRTIEPCKKALEDAKNSGEYKRLEAEKKEAEKKEKEAKANEKSVETAEFEKLVEAELNKLKNN